MSAPAILLVDPDRTRRERMAFALGDAGTFAIVSAANLDAAREELTDAKVVAVVCDEGDDGALGPALLHDVRLEPRTASLPFVLLTSTASSGVRMQGWAGDADAVLTYPVHHNDVLACIAACVRRRGPANDPAGASRQLAAVADQVQRLVGTLLDALLPGSAFRGEAVAALVSEMARELDVPVDMRVDLDRAARLHEVGRLVAAPAAATTLSAATLSGSAALIESIPGLDGAAELIAGMAANWDGSGYPSRMERGAIPLRSRILRVAVDYLDLVQSPESSGVPSDAVGELTLHGGTLYDPAVLSALGLLVSRGDPLLQTWEHTPVRVDRLTEGLILVDDLHTASGVKLLSAGAMLTAASLRLISERNATDPIVHAVATRRAR